MNTTALVKVNKCVESKENIILHDLLWRVVKCSERKQVGSWKIRIKTFHRLKGSKTLIFLEAATIQ